MRARVTAAILFAGALLMIGCRTAQHLTTTDATYLSQQAYIRTVQAQANEASAITTKTRISFAMGGKSMNLTGHLRMVRGEVIQLTIMGMGIIEAGRIEFTPDSVLFIDRINKQYTSLQYDEVRFLRQAQMDFYTLQALFWNELTPSQIPYTATSMGSEMVITMQQRGLDYKFYTDPKTATIQRTEIGVNDYTLTCTYNDFTTLCEKPFPTQFAFAVEGIPFDVQLGLHLNNPTVNDDWEHHTTPSGKYKAVTLRDIFNKMMRMP